MQDQKEFGDNEKVTNVATNVQNEYVIKNSAVQVVAAPHHGFHSHEVTDPGKGEGEEVRCISPDSPKTRLS